MRSCASTASLRSARRLLNRVEERLLVLYRALRRPTVRDFFIDRRKSMGVQEMAMEWRDGNPIDLPSNHRGYFEYRVLSHELCLHQREGLQGEILPNFAPELPTT